MDNLIDEGTPTQNSVWKKYTLYYHPHAHVVCVQRLGTSQIYSVPKDAAISKVQQGYLLSIEDQLFYDEILKLYKLMEEGDQDERANRGDFL
jgi:hypothetical protein